MTFQDRPHLAGGPESTLRTIPVGRRPRGVGVDPLHGFVYVTNSGSDTVTVIDAKSHRVDGDPIRVGPSPFGISVDSARGLAWIANLGSRTQPSTVSLLDLKSRRVTSVRVSDRPSTHGPVAVAHDPRTGLAYATHGSEGTVYALDPTTRSVAWSVSGLTDPFGVACLDNWLFVAQRSRGQVAVVDIEARRVIHSIAVGGAPLEVAVHPQLRRVYVTNHHTRSLSIIEVPSFAVRQIPIDGEPYGLTLDPRSMDPWVYVATSDDNAVSVIDSALGASISTSPTGRFPHCPGLDPETHTLYVANHHDDTVSVLPANRHQDLLLRDDFSDNGEFPSHGGLSASPDLIPWGTRPADDPQRIFRESWQQDVGKNVTEGEKNYVYVRGQNLAPGSASGKVYLHYSKGSLLLWPQHWRDQRVKTETGEDHVELRAEQSGDITVGAAPFHLDPAVVEGDHYCFIGRVATPRNPNPVPTVDNLHDFARYVATRPNVAWRNLQLVPAKDLPEWAREVQFSLEDPDEREIHFYLLCRNCPVGTEVSFHCGTPGPDPLIQIPRTRITRSSRFTTGLHSMVPGHFPGPGRQTTVTVTFWRNDHPLPPDASVSFNAAKVIDPDHPLAPYGVSPQTLDLPDSLVANRQSKVILLGQFEWRMH